MKRALTNTALGLLALHLVALSGLGGRRFDAPASNIIQALAAGLAGLACLLAARRSRALARSFWGCWSVACLLWMVGQWMWTWYENVVHVPVPHPSAVDIFYLLMYAPLALAVMLESGVTVQEWNWLLFLDGLQIGVIIILTYAKIEFLHGQALLDYLAVLPNFFNGGLAIVCWMRARYDRDSGTRRLFFLGAIFLTLFFLGDGIASRGSIKWGLATGNWTDLGWSLPFLVLAGLVAYEVKSPTTSVQTTAWCLPVNLVPALLPLLAWMGAMRLLPDQPREAFWLLLISVLTFSARLLFSEYQRDQGVRALRSSEARFRAYMDHIPAICGLRNAAGENVYVNAYTTQVTGKRADELLGKTDFDLHPPELALRYQAEDRAVLQTATTLHRTETITGRDGKQQELL
ncbi:MAG: PAS domain-containing protein, partial [Terriglobales bacterium]